MAGTDPPSSGEGIGDVPPVAPSNPGLAQEGSPGAQVGTDGVPPASGATGEGGREAPSAMPGVHLSASRDLGGAGAGKRVVSAVGTSQWISWEGTPGILRVGSNFGKEPPPTGRMEDGVPSRVGGGLAPNASVETPGVGGYTPGGFLTADMGEEGPGVPNALAEAVRHEASEILRRALSNMVLTMTETICNQVIAVYHPRHLLGE